MRIANGTHILVTDGGKMLLFRNEGDAEFLQLALIAEDEDRNPPDRGQKTDAPGRTAPAGGTDRSSAYQETDFHRQQEMQFAHRTADMLHRRAAAGAIDRLVIVADPRTLGVLRDRYSPLLEKIVTAEIAKDLVKHPVAEIERMLARETQLR